MNPILPIERLILLLAVLLGLGVYSAWRNSAKTRLGVRLGIVIARLLALLCLAAIALNPGTWRIEYEAEREEWAVLLDRSLSMTTADVSEQTRWQEACRLATVARDAAHEDLPVRVYPFAGDLEAAQGEDLSRLQPDGETTDVERAGKDLLGRYRTGGTRLAGIVLLSDGRQVRNSPTPDFAIRARAMDVAIYPLPLGGPIAPRDLTLTTPRKQLVAFVDQSTTITAVLANHGFARAAPEVTLLDGDGTVLARRRVPVDTDAEQTVSFEVKPPRTGYHTYRLTVPAWEGEARTVNNEATVGVSAIDSAIRIFVVEGAPYWDSKFLVQLLRKQPRMDVTSVYRLSAKRFFRVETDAAHVSESEAATFPDSQEALAAYDVIVMGKGAEYFLTPRRISLLKTFIRDQGGCLIFSRGKPYNGSFPELADLELVSWGGPVAKPFHLQPTPVGEEVGLFGDMLPSADDPVWRNLPPLEQAYRCTNLKAFTQVLVNGRIEAAGRHQDFPVLMTRRYGKGLIVLCNAGGLWRWDFFASQPEAGEMYKNLWSQLLQWAVTYSEFLPGQRYALHLDSSSVWPNTPVHVRVLRRHSRGDTTFPDLVVRSGDAIKETRTSEGISADRLQWDLAFSFPEPGHYEFELIAADNGDAIGARALMEVMAPPSERDNLSADPAALEALARASGGRVLAEHELVDLLRSPPEQATREQPGKTIWQPAWERGWVLGLMALLFTVEWFLRRRNGLL